MQEQDLTEKSRQYLDMLCRTIPGREVGSEGNRRATRFFETELFQRGWTIEAIEFEAIDWEDKGATLTCGNEAFQIFVSPYSLAFDGAGELVIASVTKELESLNANGKILLLHGEIAREQLMPKNFVFYNPEEHQHIVALLEKSGAQAIISATGRNAALAGGVYPFPLIEDGDFNIPSVYMTEEEGLRLLSFAGKTVSLRSRSERIPGKGYNMTGYCGNLSGRRIVVTAHIDAKKGSPGAIDNATGVIVLLLLAELLKDYDGERLIELVAFNGEDYYAVPGQMAYIAAHGDKFPQMLLNINIDGAGYLEGPSAISPFDLPKDISRLVQKLITKNPGIEMGIPWPQGDHSIFLQNGVPAIAVSSLWFIDHISDQDITHTPKDHPDIVDCVRLTEIALALNSLIRKL